MTSLEASRLILALLLPWLAGTLWVKVLMGASRAGHRALEIGYGFPAGMLLVIATMLAIDAAGFSQSFKATAALVAIASVPPLFLLAVRSSGETPMTRLRDDWRCWSAVTRILISLLAILLLVKLATLLQELYLRPLFPWDAWSLHAQKVKIWADHGELVEHTRRWWGPVSDEPGAFYVPFAFDLHPPGVPLIQLWMVQALGRYDDALMNLPWFCLAISIWLAMYGQTRYSGGGHCLAFIAAYAVLSIPIVFTHLALGGYVDIWLAMFLFMAVGFLYAWIENRTAGTGMLLAVAIIGMLAMKQSGLFWIPALFGGLIFGIASRHWLIGIVPAALALMLGMQFILGIDLVGYFTSQRLAARPQDISTVAVHLKDNLFAYASWHMLWYIFPFGLAGAVFLKDMRSRPRVALTMVVLLGLSGLLFTFFFTRAGAWVISGTSVNRVLLHIAPVVVFWVALSVQAILKHFSDASASVFSDMHAKSNWTPGQPG